MLAPSADGLEERCVLLGVQRAVVVLVAVQEDRLDHVLRLDEQPAFANAHLKQSRPTLACGSGEWLGITARGHGPRRQFPPSPASSRRCPCPAPGRRRRLRTEGDLSGIWAGECTCAKRLRPRALPPRAESHCCLSSRDDAAMISAGSNSVNIGTKRGQPDPTVSRTLLPELRAGAYPAHASPRRHPSTPLLRAIANRRQGLL